MDSMVHDQAYIIQDTCDVTVASCTSTVYAYRNVDFHLFLSFSFFFCPSRYARAYSASMEYGRQCLAHDAYDILPLLHISEPEAVKIYITLSSFTEWKFSSTATQSPVAFHCCMDVTWWHF